MKKTAFTLNYVPMGDTPRRFQDHPLYTVGGV